MNLPILEIHKLSQQQYEDLSAGKITDPSDNPINSNALYLTPDDTQEELNAIKEVIKENNGDIETIKNKTDKNAGDIVVLNDIVDTKQDALKGSIEQIVGFDINKNVAYKNRIGRDGSTIGAEIFNNYGNNEASGNYSHAEGNNTIANGIASHAEGEQTLAFGNYSHAEGYGTTTNGSAAHAEGNNTLANGSYSHAEGNNTVATTRSLNVIGEFNNFEEDTGKRPTAKGNYIHVVGNGTSDSVRKNAHTLDWDGNAWFAGNVYVSQENGDTNTNKTEDNKLLTSSEVGNKISVVDNRITTEVGTINESITENVGKLNASIDEINENIETINENIETINGNIDTINGDIDTINGDIETINGNIETINTDLDTKSTATNLVNGSTEGSLRGIYTNAESDSYTIGDYAFAEGELTSASGYASHAEGSMSKTNGVAAHAEGYDTEANGDYSHAEGCGAKATADYTHAEGMHTIASGRYQHVQGKYNVEDASGNYIHIVGNGTGTSDSARSNAHTLDTNGNAWFKGNIYVGSTSGKNKDDGSVKLVTETQLASAIAAAINALQIETWTFVLEDETTVTKTVVLK